MLSAGVMSFGNGLYLGVVCLMACWGKEETDSWEVATGVVVDFPAVLGEGDGMGWRHEGVDGAEDGGLAV